MFITEQDLFEKNPGTNISFFVCVCVWVSDKKKRKSERERER